MARRKFWRAVWEDKKYAKKVGRIATKPCLQLYYVLKRDEVPIKDKVIIIVALVYTVIPRDLIPFGRWGIFGWLDDAISIAVVVKKMKKHLTPEIDSEVEKTLDNWFCGYVEYEQL